MSLFFNKVVEYMSSYRVDRVGHRRILRLRLPFGRFDQLERDGYLVDTRDVRLNGNRIGVSGMTIWGPEGDYANINSTNLSNFWNSFAESRRRGDYRELSTHFKWYEGSGTKGFWEDIANLNDFEDYVIDVNFILSDSIDTEDIEDLVNNFDTYETARNLREGHGIDRDSENYHDDRVKEYYKDVNLAHQNVIHNSSKEILERIKKRKFYQYKWMSRRQSQQKN
jgi:hypothetical protein